MIYMSMSSYLSAAGLRKLKLALLQQAVGANKRTNLERAGSLIREAASKGAKLISLPVSKAL